MKKLTQKQIVIDFLSNGKAKTIEEVTNETNFPRPTVRRILGEGTLNGEFKREGKGIYSRTTADGKVTGIIEAGCSEHTLTRLVTEGRKFDMVFLDIAYFSHALVGGNRGIKDYGFIYAPEFKLVMDSVRQLLRTDKSHCYLMLSGAATAQSDMQVYFDVAIESGLKLVGEGGYTKLFQDGKPVTNVRGLIAQPERLILLTLSGEVEEPVELNFRFVRPKGYQSEKAKGFIRTLIEQSTLAGEWVLDAFAGSGVTGEQCVFSGRNFYLIEKIESVVRELIMPRVNLSINAYNNLL